VWGHPIEQTKNSNNMKKVTTILAAILLMAVGATAQKLSYSAVVRNSDNELVVNANLTVAVSIANSSGGAVVYSETHNVTTNQNGLVTLTIGDGTGVTGSMSDVTWQTAFITSDYTLPNGSHVVNTTPVTAVPYALYAEKSGSSAASSASIDGGAVNFSMPISDFVNNLTDEQKAELCEALGCSGGGGEPGTEPTTFTCGTSKMVDADGNEYETVQIGQQCWTKSNLRATKGYTPWYSSMYGSTPGTVVNFYDFFYALGTDPNQILMGACYSAVLDNEAALLGATLPYASQADYPLEAYGYLYNYNAAKNACPPGWHLPTGQDWLNLYNSVHSIEDNSCGSKIGKALASKSGWAPSTNDCAVGNNTTVNNITGFSAFPAGENSIPQGGSQTPLLSIFSPNHNAVFWYFNEIFSAGFTMISYDASNLLIFPASEDGLSTSYLSVRCVRD
jgi:uncharacterized protein (TIGR02145 family)